MVEYAILVLVFIILIRVMWLDIEIRKLNRREDNGN